MHVADFNALLVQIFGEILGHLLGEDGEERAVALGGGQADFIDDVVHLIGGGADFDVGVDQPGGADDLFGKDAIGLLQLPRAGGGRDIDRLRAHGVPFLEAQGAVVHAARQAEAVFGEGRLAAQIAAIHGAELTDGDVGFVDKDQGVIGEVFEQRGGRLAGLAAREIARIVFDAGAGAGGFHHFEIEQGALFEALGLEEAAHAVELLQAGLELALDLLDRRIHRGAGGDVVGIGEDAHGGQFGRFLAGQGVEFGDGFDLVAEQGDAPGGVVIVGGEHFDGVAAHPERAAHEADVAALVLQGDEFVQ